MSKTLSLAKRSGDSKTEKTAGQRSPIRGRNRNNHVAGAGAHAHGESSASGSSDRHKKPSTSKPFAKKSAESSQNRSARPERPARTERSDGFAPKDGKPRTSARPSDRSAKFTANDKPSSDQGRSQARMPSNNATGKDRPTAKSAAKAPQTVLRHGKVRDGVREFIDGRVVRSKSAVSNVGKTDKPSERPQNPKMALKSLRDERTAAQRATKAHATTATTAATDSASSERAAPAGIRISKYLADQGLCSRREADAYIEKGWVTVNGKRAELGQRVLPHERVQLARQASAAQALRVTILVNKPVGYVSGQAEDGYEPAVSLITADNQWEDAPFQQDFEFKHLRGLAPAGRLDIDSVGLLVLTQDGRVAKQLIGEDSDIDKEYLVRVEGELIDNGLQLLNHGLELDGVPLRRAQVSWQNEDQLRFVLREGKKRQIRRMCELVGLKVVGLKRIRIGKVKLGNLPTGKWRYLAEDEVF